MVPHGIPDCAAAGGVPGTVMTAVTVDVAGDDVGEVCPVGVVSGATLALVCAEVSDPVPDAEPAPDADTETDPGATEPDPVVGVFVTGALRTLVKPPAVAVATPDDESGGSACA